MGTVIPHHGGREEDFDEEEGNALRGLAQDLDKAITGGEQNYWMEWDFEYRASPMAQAFHYLQDLPLDEGGKGGDFQLGELGFVEGDRPGSNLTYVEAADLATLACLPTHDPALASVWEMNPGLERWTVMGAGRYWIQSKKTGNTVSKIGCWSVRG
jgi:hypothetical protein